MLRQQCFKFVVAKGRATLDQMCDFVLSTGLSKARERPPARPPATLLARPADLTASRSSATLRQRFKICFSVAVLPSI